MNKKIHLYEIISLVISLILVGYSIPALINFLSFPVSFIWTFLAFLNSDNIDDRWFTLVTGAMAVFAAWWTVKHQNINFNRIYSFETNREQYEKAVHTIEKNNIVVENLETLLRDIDYFQKRISEEDANNSSKAITELISDTFDIFKNWEDEIKENPNIKYDLGHINVRCTFIKELSSEHGFTDHYKAMFKSCRDSIHKRIDFIKKELNRQNEINKNIITEYRC